VVTRRAPDSTTLRNLRRRLERWELPHLRAHAAEQAERIAALEVQVAALQREATDADESGNMWRDACMRFEGTLDDDGETLGLGLTLLGNVVPVRTGALQ
jgi:hypothetical protein